MTIACMRRDNGQRLLFIFSLSGNMVVLLATSSEETVLDVLRGSSTGQWKMVFLYLGIWARPGTA